MGNDDNRGHSRGSAWANLYHRGMKATARGVGALLKLAGALAILGGLLGIALANMDGDPIPNLIEGVVTICVGLLMVYLGYKTAKWAKSS